MAKVKDLPLTFGKLVSAKVSVANVLRRSTVVDRSRRVCWRPLPIAIIEAIIYTAGVKFAAGTAWDGHASTPLEAFEVPLTVCIGITCNK